MANIPVSYTHLDVYKRQPFTEPLAGVKFNIYTDVVQPDGSTKRELVNTEGALTTVMDPANNAYTEFIKLDLSLIHI